MSLLLVANRNDWLPPQQKPATITLPLQAGSFETYSTTAFRSAVT
jgi:hypothetical protein